MGYSNGGTGANNVFYQLAGSLVNGALLNGGPNGLTTHSLNSSVPGRYILPVRNGTIVLLISSVSCSPGSLGLGGESSCTLTLTANAPAGGAQISLSSSSTALSVPASVTVSAGQTTATFNVAAANFTSSQTVTITATYGGAIQTTTISLTGSGSGITISTTTLTGGTVSSAGSQTLTASGGTAPYKWKVLAGYLPPGTTFSSTGTLSGTPTRSGTYTFTVQVTDANGNTAVQTVSITIAAPTLTITTPSPLPAGMATVQYPTQVLSATGGAAPYTFTLAQGSSLPSGLTLAANGSISGTPTAAGTFQVTVTVTDSSQPVQTGTATFAITVRPFSPDLLISSGSLAFTLASGAAALPPSQNVPVEATDPTKILNWSATITPSVNWLTLAGGKTGSTTPGAFQVALTAGASQLSASATPDPQRGCQLPFTESLCGKYAEPRGKIAGQHGLAAVDGADDLVSFICRRRTRRLRRSRLQCRIRAAGRSRLHR